MNDSENAKRSFILNSSENLILRNHEDFIELWKSHCLENGFYFENVGHNHSVLSPDRTSLFCTSGMHHLKSLYADESYFGTFGNIQKCLRLNDLSELRFDFDSDLDVCERRHFLIFHMVGFFSFRQLTIRETIFFILSFLDKLAIVPDYFTLHEDKYEEWKAHYIDYYGQSGREVPKLVIDSPNCVWQANVDEEVSYCTEIFYQGIEIGNMVNPRGDCIDVGLGMERLLMLSPLSESELCHQWRNQYRSQEILLNTIEHLLLELNDIQNQQEGHGTQYLHKGVGYQLKKLILYFLEYQYQSEGNLDMDNKIKKLKEHDLFQRVFQNKRDKLNYVLQQKRLNSKIWRNNNADFWQSVHGVSRKMYDAIESENAELDKIIQFFDLNK